MCLNTRVQFHVTKDTPTSELPKTTDQPWMSKFGEGGFRGSEFNVSDPKGLPGTSTEGVQLLQQLNRMPWPQAKSMPPFVNLEWEHRSLQKQTADAGTHLWNYAQMMDWNAVMMGTGGVMGECSRGWVQASGVRVRRSHAELHPHTPHFQTQTHMHTAAMRAHTPTRMYMCFIQTDA